IASIAAEREMRKIVSWHPDALRLDLAGPLTGRGLQVSRMPGVEVTAAERERLRGVAAAAGLGVTGVDLAVAETGTLVVVSGAGRPRSTSLLPAFPPPPLPPGGPGRAWPARRGTRVRPPTRGAQRSTSSPDPAAPPTSS